MKYILLLLSVTLTIIKTSAQTGNVGIGTANPTAQLHTTGTVRFDHLSGKGLRLLYVNDSGMLQVPRIDTFTSTASLTPPLGDCNGATSTINVSGNALFTPGKRISVTLNFSVWSIYTFIYLVAPGGQVLNLYNANQPINPVNRVIYSNKGAGEAPAGSMDSVMHGAVINTSIYDPAAGGEVPYNVFPINCSYHATIGSFSELQHTTLDGIWTLKIIHGYPHFSQNTTLASWSITVQDVDAPDPFTYINDKMGIGTNNPTSALDIVAPDNTANNILTLRTNDLTEGIGLSRNTISAIGTNNSVPLVLTSKNGGPLILNPNGGNVGINTNNPASALSIRALNNNPPLAVWSQNGNDGLFIGPNSIISGGYGGSQPDFRISSAYSNLLLNPDWGGKVGIGTATPNAKLDVAGTVNAVAVTSSANGTGSANMLAAAYGMITGNATNSFAASSGNCTLSHSAGTGIYTITFSSASPLNSANTATLPVLLTQYAAASTPGFITWTGGTGTLTVKTYNTAGNLEDRGFSFVIYKP